MLLRPYFNRKTVQSKISVLISQSRTFKNFGHKREPIPAVTTLWHGFLTFTFIGLGLNWDVISKFIFGDEEYDQKFQESLSTKASNG